MKSRQLCQCAVLIAALLCLFPQPAMAYIGPGAGLSAIGAFLAILAALVVAVFGFLWYPIKRLLRSLKQPPDDDEKGGDSE